VFTSNDKTAFTVLYRYYNAERDNGGRLKFGRLHDYRKDWVNAHSGKLPLDPRRLPLSIFQEKTFLVEVVTVRKDSKRLLLPPAFHWSKISRVIRPLEEEERWEGLPVQPLNFAD
jgi:hypothetical protein